MGCEACRQREPEANFPLGSNPEIKPEDRQNFMTTFETNLQTFGQYYSSDFNTLISQKIQDYMHEHPLEIEQKYKENLESIDVKPIEFKTGNIYEGGWNKNLKMEGQGKYYLKAENVFVEGIWKDGNIIYGRVFMTNEDELDIYEGEMKDSSFNGKGKLTSSNGQVYIGDFIDGEKTGNGKIIFADGTIYEGQVEKSELKGEGKMIWKNGYEYQGNFDGNKLSGHGILTNINSDMYEGDFTNNLFSGNGTYTFKSGNIYEGEFSYGVKKGKGIYKCLNLYEYDGDWDNNLPCGVGKLSTWNKNGIIKSSWRYGKNVEEPIYEKGSEEDFEGIDFDIKVDEMMLNIKDLSNLENTEIQTSQYKLVTNVSFLDD
jgi:hypothetical protein